MLVTTHLVEEAAAVADRVVVLSEGRVVADDLPKALTARLPNRTVTVRSELPAEEVAAMPAVASARREGPYLRIATVDAESVVRRLLDVDAQLADQRVEG